VTELEKMTSRRLEKNTDRGYDGKTLASAGIAIAGLEDLRLIRKEEERHLPYRPGGEPSERRSRYRPGAIQKRSTPLGSINLVKKGRNQYLSIPSQKAQPYTKNSSWRGPKIECLKEARKFMLVFESTRRGNLDKNGTIGKG